MSESQGSHLARRELFGDDVAAYEQGRPPYPARVYELLTSMAALGAGSRVLEIGPGTGQATVALLDAGAHVTAVELSDAFADRLVDRFAGRAFEVVRGAFESAGLDARSFDLVVAATSFHWIVPTGEALVRCADLLRPGGWLALWWNVFGDATRPDPFAEALDALLLEVEPALADQPELAKPSGSVLPYAQDVAARTAEIDATGRFGPVHYERIAWTGRHTTERARALFASFSPWLALPRERRLAALDHLARLADERFGGVVTRPYQTPIYLARRH